MTRRGAGPPGGRTDVDVVRAEGLAFGPTERAAAIEGALGRIEGLEVAVLAA